MTIVHLRSHCRERTANVFLLLLTLKIITAGADGMESPVNVRRFLFASAPSDVGWQLLYDSHEDRFSVQLLYR